ncbi:MAG TPA: hypothetical protein VKB12_09685 [Pyrinomonadaceae bacterium]|nr:hypothetical protein [Pyrinomonadaceae bacterium]
MSTSPQIVGRQTLVAPLGLRFRDAATGAAISQGLRVTLYPTANPSRRTQAFVNNSGVYVAHRAAGLRGSEMGAGDEEFWDAPPSSAPFTVEVFDEERRYLPYSFPATLPSKGIRAWTWPLAEAASRQPPEPAATLSDDFADGARGAQWKLGTLNTPASVFDSNVAVAEQGGRLEITPLADATGSHFNGYVSVSGWNLTDARATVEAAQAAAGAAHTIFTLGSDANNWFRFLVEAGRLNFQTRVGGAESSPSVEHDPAQQRFWRLRHERRDDKVIFETSGDGAAWVARRSLARPFAVTSLLVELGAGTASKVAAPGKAVFDSLRMESNPTSALPLFSAPTRSGAGGLATLRASLWDANADAPAAWALLEARITGQTTVRGLADERGRVALVFPYPEPAAFAEQSPPSAPFAKQEWPVQLFASYLPQRPVPTLPSLPDALAQPRAKLWADSGLTAPLAQATLRSGQELVVRSFDTSPEAPAGGKPLSVLLITPAGSPP